ncbi:hypothetical protein, partial [Vibrio breoganii]|uniref:hypothetical protein n=1 Tax=Vibrio breoganii TaxID=553239 RepID=UPI001A7E0D73
LEASSFQIVIVQVSYRQSHHLCIPRSQLTTCWDDGLLVAGSLKLAALSSSFFQKQQKSFVKDTIFHKPVLLNNPLHRLIHTVSA